MYDRKKLEGIGNQLRLDVVKSVYKAKSGHIGGCLSAAELIAVLYFYKMQVDPRNPTWEERDRFVLSKGHAAPVLYGALARRGFFPMEDLDGLRQAGSHLQGAPNPKTPGVDMSSGPLGQGLSAAVGMALAARAMGTGYLVYCMLGDGELQEGQVWEAAMAAAKYRLNHLIGILDYNKVQMSGSNEEIMPLGDVKAKFQSFGWETCQIDGHQVPQIVEALDKRARGTGHGMGKPMMVIADTLKGKGVSFMEGKAAWHGALPTKEEYCQAMEELENLPRFWAEPGEQEVRA